MPTHVNCLNEESESVLFSARIGLDYWAVAWNETKWKLTSLNNNNNSNDVFWHDHGASYSINDSIVDYEMCLIKPLRKNDILMNDDDNDDIVDCYIFELFDSFGDGLDDSTNVERGDGSNVVIYLNHYLVNKTEWINGFYLKIKFCIS